MITRFNKLPVEEKEALLGLSMKMTQFEESEGRQFEALWANGVWEVLNGRPIMDPACIECPIILLRGDSDTTSTRSDALNLFNRLSSSHRRYVEIFQGTHYANLDKIAWQILSKTLEFFAQIESHISK